MTNVAYYWIYIVISVYVVQSSGLFSNKVNSFYDRKYIRDHNIGILQWAKKGLGIFEDSTDLKSVDSKLTHGQRLKRNSEGTLKAKRIKANKIKSFNVKSKYVKADQVYGHMIVADSVIVRGGVRRDENRKGVPKSRRKTTAFDPSILGVSVDVNTNDEKSDGNIGLSNFLRSKPSRNDRTVKDIFGLRREATPSHSTKKSIDNFMISDKYNSVRKGISETDDKSYVPKRLPSNSSVNFNFQWNGINIQASSKDTDQVLVKNKRKQYGTQNTEGAERTKPRNIFLSDLFKVGASEGNTFVRKRTQIKNGKTKTAVNPVLSENVQEDIIKDRVRYTDESGLLKARKLVADKISAKDITANKIKADKVRSKYIDAKTLLVIRPKVKRRRRLKKDFI